MPVQYAWNSKENLRIHIEINKKGCKLSDFRLISLHRDTTFPTFFFFFLFQGFPFFCDFNLNDRFLCHCYTHILTVLC